MARKSRISTVVLALSITLRVIPITAQLNAAQPSVGRQNLRSSQGQTNRANQEHRNTKTTQQPTSQTTPVTQVFGTPNEAATPAQPKESKTGKLLDRLADPIVWVTVVIAAFAFWQVCI